MNGYTYSAKLDQRSGLWSAQIVDSKTGVYSVSTTHTFKTCSDALQHVRKQHENALAIASRKPQ